MKRFFTPIGISWPNNTIFIGRRAKFVKSSAHSKQNQAVLWIPFEMFTIFDALLNTTTVGERT